MQEQTYTPNLELHLNEYLDRHANKTTELQFTQVETNANTAFREVVPEAVGMMPVAMAQEPPKHIQNSLEQLTQQLDDPEVRPFSVVLSANYPDVNNSEYERNRERNKEAIYDFQQSKQGKRLPFSFYEQVYVPETTIGAIRRDLSIVSLEHARRQYDGMSIPRHLGMLILDVDTIKLSPKFMSRQQKALRDGYSWTCANVRYPTTNGEHPNLDRAIHALNLSHKMSPLASYDAYSMYRAETLIAGGTFVDEDSAFETHEMRRRAERVMGKFFVAPDFRQADGAYAVSSPRRIEDKYRNGYAQYEFWNKGEFGMQDAYRQGIAADKDILDTLSDYYVGDSIGTITGRGRDALVTMHWEEQGDLSYAQIRAAVDAHITRTLEVADIRLNLQLGRLSVFDIVRRPAVEVER